MRSKATKTYYFSGTFTLFALIIGLLHAFDYVKCPCNNFIKRHFNQYFVNNNDNARKAVAANLATGRS